MFSNRFLYLSSEALRSLSSLLRRVTFSSFTIRSSGSVGLSRNASAPWLRDSTACSKEAFPERMSVPASQSFPFTLSRSMTPSTSGRFTSMMTASKPRSPSKARASAPE